jgi:hypothetical protein
MVSHTRRSTKGTRSKGRKGRTTSKGRKGSKANKSKKSKKRGGHGVIGPGSKYYSSGAKQQDMGQGGAGERILLK